ncbi:hypothetical protein [Clostridium sp. MD294]|uniref:hypothetical protein n=1 Tax=Clostridium sp. MD294 TaxID=97138 RepID=UPI0002CA685B|nr:hypothetical protein [Clostridium sp. MD294]NDO45706.1 hypothetical protein [Clostridium sp. MD294]USF30641.1 hypothetical protein C820_002084 [Clostridium sp. MD294]
MAKVKKVKPLKLMITIVDRGKSKKLMSYYKSQGINFSILCFGKGTASSEILDYLGLNEEEKDVFISTVYADDIPKIFAQLKEKTEFHKAGKGIVFTISLDSIGGMSSFYALTGISKEE